MMRTSLLMVVLLAAFTGCDPFNNEQQQITELNEARDLWEKVSADYSEGYQVRYQRLCFCYFTEEVWMQADSDSVLYILNPDGGGLMYLEHGEEQTYVLDEIPDTFKTVDQLFEIIEDATSRAEMLEVSYDQEKGYPNTINIDYSSDIADEEVSFRLSDLYFLRYEPHQ
tara:strand:- start:35457 stop:35963 length:507 start_codon:yes stop_codon:yes gene_type:complete